MYFILDQQPIRLEKNRANHENVKTTIILKKLLSLFIIILATIVPIKGMFIVSHLEPTERNTSRSPILYVGTARYYLITKITIIALSYIE